MDSDEDLLARSVREPEAFEPLVARHSVALHGYLTRRAPSSADDLLSEVWLQAFAGRASFDARRGTARGWLFGVAHHVLSAHWRRADRLTSTAADANADVKANAGRSDANDPWHAVDQRLDAAAVAPRLRDGLSELPDVERELILLMAWERLTPTEAAEVLGIPAGTARSRLHRARKKLQISLDRTTPRVGVRAANGATATGDLS
jgi:RNA polymerase sigma factor (sigma-70 family)